MAPRRTLTVIREKGMVLVEGSMVVLASGKCQLNESPRVQFKVRQVIGENLEFCCPEGTLESSRWLRARARYHRNFPPKFVGTPAEVPEIPRPCRDARTFRET